MQKADAEVQGAAQCSILEGNLSAALLAGAMHVNGIIKNEGGKWVCGCLRILARRENGQGVIKGQAHLP